MSKLKYASTNEHNIYIRYEEGFCQIRKYQAIPLRYCLLKQSNEIRNNLNGSESWRPELKTRLKEAQRQIKNGDFLLDRKLTKAFCRAAMITKETE